MGQQQLLLLVLGIVIVGIAVVAGITAFSEGKGKAERDAASADAMRLISDIQAWKLKPAAFGGGAADSTFNGLSFQAVGITPNTSGNYVTTNGCFTLADGDVATVGVYEPGSDCDEAGKIADVEIAGSTSTDLTWTYAE